MAAQFVDIDNDKAVKVKIQAIKGNSLPLYLKFTDNKGEPYDVSGIGFVFTVSDYAKTMIEFQVSNSDWTRPSASEIKKIVTPFNLEAERYKVDFTATYSDGQVRTLFDGEMVVRNREMYGG